MTVSRPQVKTTVYLDGKPWPEARLISVREAVGASNRDSAVIEVRKTPFTAAAIMQDKWVLGFTDSQCMVTIHDRAGKERVVHYGRIAQLDTQMGAGEKLIMHSRLDDHLFGYPWMGQVTLSVDKPIPAPKNLKGRAKRKAAAAGLPLGYIDEPAVMNPIVDGEVIPNMATKGLWRPVAFLEPDGLPRNILHKLYKFGEVDKRKLLTGVTMDYWSLFDAVFYACWFLNPDQKHVKNPSLRNLRTLGWNRNLLRDVRFNNGEYLPRVLDRLLLAYGFHWWIEKTKSSRQIRIQPRGGIQIGGRLVGVAGATPARDAKRVSLKLQRYGKTADSDKSEVKNYNLRGDIADRSSTHVLVMGDYERVEATVELIPAWKPEYDSLTEADLARSKEESIDDSERQRVWRDFVLNEGGDYTNKDRAGEIADPDYRKRFEKAFTYQDLFLESPPTGPVLPGWANRPRANPAAILDHLEKKRPKAPEMILRRRRMGPTLTLGADGAPIGRHHGLHVEYTYLGKNSDDPDDADWRPIEELGQAVTCVPLKNECGIRLGGYGIITQLRTIGIEYLRIRVTATFQSDWRLKYLAEHPTFGFGVHGTRTQPDIQIVDLATYQHNFYQAKGDYKSVLHGKKIPSAAGSEVTSYSTAVDDRMKMKELGDELMKAAMLPSVSGQVTIEGIDSVKNFLGASVTGIDEGGTTSRNISFRLLDRGSATPDIVGVEYDIAGQQTVLTLDTYRK